MIVVSIGGVANDGISYHMWLELPFSQPSNRLERLTRAGGSPLVTQTIREALPLTMGVIVFGLTEAAALTARETLLAALDTNASGAAIPLIVSDDDAGNQRYRYVMVQAVDEQTDEDGPGQKLAVSLITHGETHWRSTTATTVTWNATASGQTQAVANGGSLPARPVYTIKPTSSKATGFIYKVFSPVTWTGREAYFYPVDVALNDIDGLTPGWDTQSLIAGGKITGESNVAVMIDGRLRRYWWKSYDNAESGLWVNLDFAEYTRSYLLTSIGAGDTISTIAAARSIDSYPFSGILQIDSEVFTYTGKDNSQRLFTGVTRAAKGSAAEAHTGGADDDGDEIYWIQHDIWILYGGTGSWSNGQDLTGPGDPGVDVSIQRPIFGLDTSTNAIWNYEYFAAEDRTRVYSATWGRATRPESVSMIVESGWATSIIVQQTTGVVGNPSFPLPWMTYSAWALRLAYPLSSLYVWGESTNHTASGLWEAGFYTGDSWMLASSYLAIPNPQNYGSPVSFALSTTDDTESIKELSFMQRSAATMSAQLDQAILYFADYPRVTLQPEMQTYDLDMTLANTTTGQSITLNLPMELNQELEVDTDDHTVVLLADGSSQYQALEKNAFRREILPLSAGNNTLSVTETGLAGMTITITFEERTYS